MDKSHRQITPFKGLDRIKQFVIFLTVLLSDKRIVLALFNSHTTGAGPETI